MISTNLAFREGQLSARPGIGVIHMTLNLRCNAHPRPDPATPYLLAGEVRLESPNQSHYLAMCRSDRPFWLRDGSSDVDVSIDLRTEQWELIEDLRNGGDVAFVLDFTAVAVSGADPHSAVLSGQQSRLSVPASRWSDILLQARIAERFILVIPNPPASADRMLHAAWQSWQKAREAVDGGRWRDAVQNARDVIELLGAKQDPSAVPTARTKEERWLSMGAAAWRLTSAGKHADGSTFDIDWSRADAVAVVALSGGLLRAMLPPSQP